MSSLPKISIVIPSLNKVDYIKETLESVVSQDYPDFEVIIHDGGSIDGTLEIIKKYKDRYPDLITWESKNDKGQMEALNEGFVKATGDIITYINADDVYEKDSLLKVGKAVGKHPGYFWYAGKGKIIDGSGRAITPWVTKYKDFLLRRNSYQLLLMVNYLIQPSVFIKREAFQKYGPFVGWKGRVLEYALWLKIGKDQMPRVINEYISSFRIVEGSISSSLYRKILTKDYEIASKYTDNPVILLLHSLNNLGRIIAINLLGRRET